MGANSRYLGGRALLGLEKVGDAMMPGDGEFPSFSGLGAIAHVDDIMEHVHAEDLGALNMLLTVLSFLPAPLIEGFVRLLEFGITQRGAAGGFFRQVHTGLRSVIVTLYFSGKAGPGYSGKTPLDVIDYHVNPVR